MGTRYGCCSIFLRRRNFRFTGPDSVASLPRRHGCSSGACPRLRPSCSPLIYKGATSIARQRRAAVGFYHRRISGLLLTRQIALNQTLYRSTGGRRSTRLASGLPPPPPHPHPIVRRILFKWQPVALTRLPSDLRPHGAMLTRQTNYACPLEPTSLRGGPTNLRRAHSRRR